VLERRVPCGPFTFPGGQGKRHRNANDEHEDGLDQIPEPKAIPGVVVKLLNDGISFREVIGHCSVYQSGFGYKEEHRYPPIGIQGK
jgi:hypothetical protein